MKLRIGQELCGFCVTDTEDIEDVEGTLYTLYHKKCATRLHFLDRKDENKTFAITFKTIPEDDTGVFHIIEHSVLCGSRKYPVKEPFVHLLKSSLYTFLNAMTYPDKTMYPVSSRNEKDFLNLTDVYLDAVFHPLMLENKSIFLQEGWHADFSEEGKLLFNGVVYNEMKGVFASADELSLYHINRMLYPNSIYRYESGGEPSAITSLTYEQFVCMHKKYYHPTNAEIFLDGQIPLKETLELIDSYLSEYEWREPVGEIENGTCMAPVSRECEYEISKGESAENKERLVVGYISADFSEQKRTIAINLLLNALLQSNASPLKAKILESGLCEDVVLSGMDSVKENSVVITFRNVKDGKSEQLFSYFVDAVSGIVKSGIDKELLYASLNSLEFQLREKDFGTCPKGIVYAMTVPSLTLYGGKASDSLVFSEHIASLREDIRTDFYERLLSELVLENERRATLIMHPSSELGEKNREAERRRAESFKSSLCEEQISLFHREYDALCLWQSSEDSEQAVASLPRLSVSDVSDKVPFIPERVISGETCVVCHDIDSSGIIYADYYFDVSDISEDRLSRLRLLLLLFTNLKTEKRAAVEIQKLVKSELGAFDFSINTAVREGGAKIYVVMSVSAIASKVQIMADLISEIIYETVFSDKEAVRAHLRQLLFADEDTFVGSGHQAAITRALSYFSTEGAAKEIYSGLFSHEALLQLDKDYDSVADSYAEELLAAARDIFAKERLILSLVGTTLDESTVKTLIACIRSGEKCAPVRNIKPLSAESLGIAIPGGVSCAALGGKSEELYRLRAEMSVAKLILSYEHLWNRIRVIGGAYGAGFTVRPGGNGAFYSFRDPTPSKSFSAFIDSADFLREFAKSGESIEGYVIAAVGDSDPITTPRLRGTIAMSRYLSGKTYEDACDVRARMLKVGKEQLLACADALERFAKSAKLVIVGNADACLAASDILDRTVDYK